MPLAVTWDGELVWARPANRSPACSSLDRRRCAEQAFTSPQHVEKITPATALLLRTLLSRVAAWDTSSRTSQYRRQCSRRPISANQPDFINQQSNCRGSSGNPSSPDYTSPATMARPRQTAAAVMPSRNTRYLVDHCAGSSALLLPYLHPIHTPVPSSCLCDSPPAC